jgi:hypothetical protein
MCATQNVGRTLCAVNDHRGLVVGVRESAWALGGRASRIASAQRGYPMDDERQEALIRVPPGSASGAILGTGRRGCGWWERERGVSPGRVSGSGAARGYVVTSP